MSQEEPKMYSGDEPITEDSILEAEIESLAMQLGDLEQWFPVILGKDNLNMTVERKKKIGRRN